MLGSTQRGDGSERVKRWSPLLPAFPPRCSQWLLHHIPARKDHDDKLQFTPSLPLGREWLLGTEPPQELHAGPCPIVLVFVGEGESLTSTWRAGDHLKVRNTEVIGTDSLMKYLV